MDAAHIQWARRIQAIAQTGLEYAENAYDRERYEQLQQVAAEMTAGASDISQHQWQALFEREVGYATPKIDVRGAVFRDGQVLLSREKDDGRWSLPGGWADVNDPPSAAVIRELREETGYEIRSSKLAAVLDRDLHCSDDLPPLSLHRTLPEQITLMYEHYQHPSLPTVFD